MAAAPAAIMVTGTLMSVYGQYKSAQAQAYAATKDQQLRDAQATEILNRAETNVQDAVRRGHELVGTEISQYAKGNVVISGSPLMQLEQTNEHVQREINNIREDATYRANSVRIQGQAEGDQAQQIKDSSNYQIAGTLLTSGAKYFESKGQV